MKVDEVVGTVVTAIVILALVGTAIFIAVHKTIN